MAPRIRTIARVLTLLLLPLEGEGGEARRDAPGRLEKVVLLSLCECCPDACWSRAEENLRSELGLQNIHCEVLSSGRIDDAEAARDFAALARAHRADGVVSVSRVSETRAAVRLFVRDGITERSLFRRLFVDASEHSQAPITAALRAVEALVASFEQIVEEKSAAGAPEEPTPNEAAPAESGPLFGATAEPDAFVVAERDAGTVPGARPEEAPILDTPRPKESPDGTASTAGRGSTPNRRVNADPRDESPKSGNEVSSHKLGMNIGGSFAFSPGNAGVRSGFTAGARYLIYSGLSAELEVVYAPFGPEIAAEGVTSDIDLVLIRGWGSWRFWEKGRVSALFRLGGGGALVFAEGVESEVVSLTHDRTRVAVISAGTTMGFVLSSRVSIAIGVSLGATIPKVVVVHRSRTAAELGRPLFEWTARAVVGLF